MGSETKESRKQEYPKYKKVIEDAFDKHDIFNDWELEFIFNMSNLFAIGKENTTLSEKQWDKLDAVEKKVYAV